MSRLFVLIKFTLSDPNTIQDIELLKLKFRTWANSKVVKRIIAEYPNLAKENQILIAQNESMSAEIDRLRELLSVVSKDKYRY